MSSGEAKEDPLLGGERRQGRPASEATTATNTATNTTDIVYKVAVVAAGLCFAAMTLTLAILFPVRKHKFERTSCVPHAELVSLVHEVVGVAAPVAFEYGCSSRTMARARVDCQLARAASREAARDYCKEHEEEQNPLCDRVSSSVYMGDDQEAAFVDWCARSPDRGELRVCNAPLAAALEQCLADAACVATREFWQQPDEFCANTTLWHTEACERAGELQIDLERDAVAYCKNQSIVEGKVCSGLVVAMHDRGHWARYCDTNVIKKAQCEVFKRALNQKLDDKCGKSDRDAQICAAARAVAKRYSNESEEMPILGALTEASKLFCSTGSCGGEGSRRERIEKGFLVREAVAIGDVGSLCEAWPETAAVCANLTAKLNQSCHSSPLALLGCDWAKQLNKLRLNVSSSNVTEDLITRTWRTAGDLCVQHRKGSDVVRDACNILGILDEAALGCPKMFPLLAKAQDGAKKRPLFRLRFP